MPGPIGMAVAKAIAAVRCPHCGTRQARARDRQVAYYVCTRCHRRFEARPASGTPSGRRR